MVGILSNSVMDEELKVCKEQNANIPAVQARVSERLRIKKKRRELAVRANKVAETHSKAIELTQVPIQHGNPAHKILFLTRLGLTPKSGVQLPPYLHINRLSSGEVDAYKNSSTSSITSEDFSSEYTSETDHSGSDIDEDDLDLELVISPVDIPEFFEEIYKKKPKKRRHEKLRKPLPLPPSKAQMYVKEIHHNRPQLPMYRPVRTVQNITREPLYRQAFNRVQGQDMRNFKRSNGRVQVVRTLNSLKGHSVPMGALSYTGQVNCEAKLDTIRQRLLNYNTVLEYAE